MTPASKRFLHPEAIKRIGRLEIRARHIVEGLLSGMHRSPYFGQSVEFLQHREYAPGDDLRHVDWKVWAKQDRCTSSSSKKTPTCAAACWSMSRPAWSTAAAPLTKYDYAVTAAAAWPICCCGSKTPSAASCSTKPFGKRSASHEHEPPDDDRPRARATRAARQDAICTTCWPASPKPIPAAA